MNTQPEFEYISESASTKEAAEEKANEFKNSLAYHFYLVKYTFLMCLKISEVDKKNTDNSSDEDSYLLSPLKKRTVDGKKLVYITLDDSSLYFDFRKQNWYYFSSKYPFQPMVKLSDLGYIGQLKNILRKKYGVYYYFPWLIKEHHVKTTKEPQ